MYRGMYKCRLCGKVYEEIATSTKETAWQAVAHLSDGIGFDDPLRPGMMGMHCCEDGSYEISDFQGFKKENENA